MTPNQTSREAYLDHVIEGKASSQRARILRLLVLEYPRSYSRAELARIFAGGMTSINGRYMLGLGKAIPLASVCGRVKALLDAGLIEVDPDRDDPDPETGHRVEYIRAVMPEPAQRRFEL